MCPEWSCGAASASACLVLGACVVACSTGSGEMCEVESSGTFSDGVTGNGSSGGQRPHDARHVLSMKPLFFSHCAHTPDRGRLERAHRDREMGAGSTCEAVLGAGRWCLTCSSNAQLQQVPTLSWQQPPGFVHGTKGGRTSGGHGAEPAGFPCQTREDKPRCHQMPANPTLTAN